MKLIKLKNNNFRIYIKNKNLIFKINQFKSFYLKKNFLRKQLSNTKFLFTLNKKDKLMVLIKEKNVFLNLMQNIKFFYKNFNYGYLKILELKGIGYKIHKNKNKIILDLGLSHYIMYDIPFQVICIINKNKLYCFSYDFNKLNKLILNMKYLKKKSVYQIKGLFYQNEIVKIKVGKQK